MWCPILQFWISCEGSGFLQNCSLVYSRYTYKYCIYLCVCVCVCVSTTYINYKTYVGVCVVFCCYVSVLVSWLLIKIILNLSHALHYISISFLVFDFLTIWLVSVSRGRVLNLIKPIHKHIHYYFHRHTLESITCAVDKLKVLLDFFFLLFCFA